MKLPTISTLLVVAILSGCDSQTSPVAGTGSQTGNAVMSGRILGDSSSGAPGAPPAGTAVYLRPLDWTPRDTTDNYCLQVTYTDAQGNYSFKDVPPRTYRVEVRGKDRGWSRTVQVAASRTTTVPDGRLAKWGRLFLEVEMTDTVSGGVVEFYGLDRTIVLPVSNSGEQRYTIDSIPVGLQTVRIWSPLRHAPVFDAPVRIVGDSTVKVEYENWNRNPTGPREDDE